MRPDKDKQGQGQRQEQEAVPVTHVPQVRNVDRVVGVGIAGIMVNVTVNYIAEDYSAIAAGTLLSGFTPEGQAVPFVATDDSDESFLELAKAVRARREEVKAHVERMKEYKKELEEQLSDPDKKRRMTAEEEEPPHPGLVKYGDKWGVPEAEES